MFPGGAAERAGLRVGDRLISVGGRRAVLDLESFERETERPAGTRVRVVVDRNGKRLSKTMTLVRMLE